MVVVQAVAAPAWPRRWPDQHPLLERQHDRLEALLLELVQLHALDGPAWSGPETAAAEASCRRWLWDLRLHLRLEERWLADHGCLCPGHRAAHRDGLTAALSGFQRCGGDRPARLDWLTALQAWFGEHRQGPDAMAYGLAASNAKAPCARSPQP